MIVGTRNVVREDSFSLDLKRFGFSMMFWEFSPVAKHEYSVLERNCSFDMSKILKDKEQQTFFNFEMGDRVQF